jgi:dienelactone hydrolase
MKRVCQITILIAGLLSIQDAFSFQERFLHRKVKLSSIKNTPIDSTSSTITYDVQFTSDKKDTIRGRIRKPIAEGINYPLAFLVVGVETGREVVNMISGFDSVIVFGMDYPFKGEMDFSSWKSITTALALREAGYKTIPQLLLCLDWLSTLSEVDTSNITIVAVSFGVFTAVPAAALDRRVDRLVVIQGGGDLYSVFSANAERLKFPLPPFLAGWLGMLMLAPFEPNDYIEKFSPRPFLLISGESDALFPTSSVQSLFDHAKEPKEWIKHKSVHVAPDERELILELTKLVGKKLYGGR